ncbi:hypothetical protein, partial [Paenibacillus phytohabitans]|uniref:hypothetical protein n=1 Tax=Paenibacillus phytohabitans TaxID=2654978 RepID=UPI00300A832E
TIEGIFSDNLQNINKIFHKIVSVLTVSNKDTNLIGVLIILLGIQQRSEKLNTTFNCQWLIEKEFKEPKNEISRILLIMILDSLSNSQINIYSKRIIDTIRNNESLTSYVIDVLKHVGISNKATEKLACEIYLQLNEKKLKETNQISSVLEYLKEFSEGYPTIIENLKI